MKRLLLLVLANIFILPLSAKPQELEYVGSTLWSGIHDVDVVGNYAFCAFSNGLVILNIAQPDSIQFIGQEFLPKMGRNTRCLQVDGEYAFITDSDSGLQIVNIANLTDPFLVSSYEFTDRVIDLYVRGSYIFVINCAAGLEIANISNPAQPVPVGALSMAACPSRIDIQGEYAYLAGDNFHGFWIVDISNPANPILAGTAQSDHDVMDIKVVGQYAYLVDGNSEIEVWSVVSPVNPLLISETVIGGMDVIITSASYAYVIGDTGPLKIIDISNPNGPNVVGQYYTPDGSDRLEVEGSHIYAPFNYPYGNSCLSIIDVSNPSTPQVSGTYDASHSSYSVFVSGDYAYICDVYHGLNIVALNDMSRPEPISRFESGSAVTDVFVSGNYAYLAAQSRLKIIDVSNRYNPVQVSVFNSGYGPGIFVRDTLAFIGGKIINVSDPQNPSQIGTFSGSMSDVEVIGNYAYVAALQEGLNVFNISNPTQPQLVGHLATPGTATGIDVVGNYCFLSYYIFPPDSAGICIVNVANPIQPRMIFNSYAFNYMVDIFADESYLYLPDDNDGLKILDITDPSNPQTIAAYPYITGADGVFESDGYIYLAANSATVIFRFESNSIENDSFILPHTSTLLSSYPNPFNSSTTISFELPLPSQVTLVVYNLLGQKVATIFEGNRPAGMHKVVWDAEGVLSGTYFARMATDSGDRREAKLVLVK